MQLSNRINDFCELNNVECRADLVPGMLVKLTVWRGRLEISTVVTTKQLYSCDLDTFNFDVVNKVLNESLRAINDAEKTNKTNRL